VSAGLSHDSRARAARACACAAALLLAACAAPIRDPWGLAVARGDSVAARAPATFQADLGVRPRVPGAVPFSARLYGERLAPAGDSSGVSSRRYRLDVFGFPSAIVASWLWRDGHWLLVRHDRREAVSGEGSALGAEDSPLRLPDVAAILGALAGEPLPGYPGSGTSVADGHGLVRWISGGTIWEARVDPNTGLCREARSASLTLRYAKHRRHEGVVIPDEIEVVTGGNPLLSLVVRDWKGAPVWKKNPFDLSVPPGYERK
jgi:hypothetical protein